MNNQQIIEQAIEMISRLMAELEAQVFAQEGFSDLTMRQLLYLETIAQLDRPTFSQLAQELTVTKPSVTAIIQKLNRMGYVTKVQSHEDRRVHHIMLTTKGEQINEMHEKTHKLLAERLTENLSEDEVQQLTSLLQKIMR